MATVVSDTFTGSNGTALNSHVGETGATWRTQAGYGAGCQIQTNRCTAGGSWTSHWASGVFNDGAQDATASFYQMGAGYGCGIGTRMAISANTSYLLQWSPADGGPKLWRMTGGASTQLAFYSTTTPANGTSTTMRLNCTDASKDGYVAGTLQLQSTDNTNTNVGRAGVRMSSDSSSGFHIDSLSVVGTAGTSYTISLSASPGGSGTVSGGGVGWANGDSCTVGASPAANYHFVNWTEGGSQVSTSASYTFTVSGNRTLVANFALDTRTGDLNATIPALTLTGVAVGPPTLRTVTVKPSGGDYTTLVDALATESKDLDSLNRILRVECYGPGETMGGYDFYNAGWITTPDRYLDIVVPQSERHLGKPGTGFRLALTGGVSWQGFIFSASRAAYVRFRGLAINCTRESTYSAAFGLGGAVGDFLLEDLLVYSTATAQPTDCYAIDGSSMAGTTNMTIRNCIIVGRWLRNIHMTQPSAGTGRLVIENCTVKGANVDGIAVDYENSPTLRNNISVGNNQGGTTGLDFLIGNQNLGTPVYANNLSSDTSAPTGSEIRSASLTFRDAANKDLHLASTDTAAIGAGADLSASFTDDACGTYRKPSAWDVGAFAYYPKAETLTDDFGDNSLSGTKWATDLGGSGAISETGAQLSVSIPTDGNDQKAWVVSQNIYDLTGSYAYVKVTPFTSDTQNRQLEWLRLVNPANTAEWVGIHCHLQGTYYYARYHAADGSETDCALNGVTSGYPWIRMRVDASTGILYFEKAPDSSGQPGSWIAINDTSTYRPPFSVAGAKLSIGKVQIYSGSTARGASIFDGFNGPLSSAATGNLNATIPALTVTGAAGVAVQGSLSAAIPALTLTGVAVVVVQGTSSVTIPALTVTGVGVVTQHLRPNGDVTKTGWTGVGDPTNLFANLDEVTPNDGDYAKGPPSTSNSILRVALSNAGFEIIAGTWTLRTRLARAGSLGTVTALVRLMEGASTRASFSHALSGTPTTFEDVLSGAQVASIVDANALEVEIEQVIT